jgi:hypothetical protein
VISSSEYRCGVCNAKITIHRNLCNDCKALYLFATILWSDTWTKESLWELVSGKAARVLGRASTT